jgi:hypothetical protein
VTLRRAIARLEIWDKLECDGGVRLAFARNITSAISSWSLEGDEKLRFSLPSKSNAAAAISDLRIARCWRADDDYDEWLIAPTDTTRARGGTVSVTCWPINYLLSIRGLVPEWQITDPKGQPLLDVGVTQLTIEEILQTYIVDNTRINADMPWLSLGTIEPTTLVDVSWSGATRRALINACLDALAAKGELAEFRLRRDGTSGYLIDILNEIGSDAPLVPLRIGRNLQTLTRTVDPTERYTRMKPETNPIGGEPTFLGNARWLVTNNVAGVLTVADPAGGPPPVGFDDQFNTIGAYYLYREITAQAYAITDSAVSPNTVTITGDPGIAVGEFVQFRTSATAGTPIAVGVGGQLSSLSRGYVLPLLATGKASNVLTLSSYISTPALPTADGQYVGDDVAFSNFVQTSVGDFIGTDTWPNYTIVWSSGTNFSGLAVGDWLITGDLSVWEGGGGSGTSLPSMTVTNVIDSTHIEVTIRGKGPSFNQGAVSVPLQFFRPVASNLTGTIAASSASAHTVTVDDATGITATSGAPCALELSYTPVAGELPYYLDHPIFASETPPGIGIKFGTMDRREFTAVANLSPNAFARHWTAGVADGYAIVGPGSMSENTDPLYTELGGSSILVTLSGQARLDTPPIAWRPAYQGQRFSVRAHLLIPADWSGNRSLEMRLGIVKADGTKLLWGTTDPVNHMVPPDIATAASTWTKPAGGVWFDAVLNGFDITAATNIAPSLVRQSDLVDAVAYFVSFVGGNTPPFYLDAISITPSDVAVGAGNITEFGQANNAWQDTNIALRDTAIRQETVSVDAVDLARLNPALRDTDSFVPGGTVLVNDLDLGLTNQRWRVVEIPERDELVPAKIRITLASRTKRFTDLFLKRVSSLATSSAASTAAAQSSGNGTTTVTPPPSSTGTGTTGPSITLGVELDSALVPTATAVGGASVVRVKFAGRTDRYPTAAEVRAGTSVTAAPFTTTFPAISAGETEYVSALAYDAADNEGPLATASVQDATPGGNGFYRTLTIDHTKVGASDSVDFPVLVKLTNASLATIANGGKVENASGYDIGFFLNAGLTTRLSHEARKYDPVTGTIIYWVKVPTVSHTVDTVIYMTYGDPTITTDQSDVAGVWSNGFVRDAHMGDGVTLSGAESVSGQNFAITGATAAAGEIHGAGSFDWASNKYMKNTAPAATTVPITFSAWVKLADTSFATNEDRTIVSINKTSASDGFWMGYFNQSGTILFRVAIQDATLSGYARGDAVIDTNWHLLHGILGANVAIDSRLYQDGSLLGFTGSLYTGGSPTPAGLTDTYIGGQFQNTSTFYGAFKGLIEEVRIATVVRSADWITAEWNNQSSPSTFISLGAENGYDAGSGAILLSYVRSGGDVVVTANARFATSVKIAASLVDSPVTDAEVRAAPAITTRPFSATFAAPALGQVLHVGAFAYFASLGGFESAKATTDIPAAAGVFGGGTAGDGSTIPVITVDDGGNITSVTEVPNVAAFTPTHIPVGETFHVPANKQVLYALSIDVEGTLDVDGALVAVN